MGWNVRPKAGSMRFALALASLLALGACLLGPRQNIDDANAGRTPGDFQRLPQYVSRNGLLKLTLVAAPKTIVIDGVRLDGLAFNGDYAGPVLRLKPGDRLALKLVNRTPLPVNLHFHGSYTSPQVNGDNIHIVVPAGASFDYRMTVPQNQPPGLYWYHTHIHGLAEQQVGAGLSGAMIIDGVESRVPEVAGARQRLLVLKTFDVARPGDADVARLHGVVQTINGVAHSDVAATAGVPEFWRISNQSANDYYHLSIKGVRFRIVGLDGAPTQRDIEADQLDIPPAGRVEAMVVLPTAGDYHLLSGATPTGVGRDFKINRELALIHVAQGAPVTASPAIGERRGPMSSDLRQAVVTAKRLVVFSQVPGQEVYLINGKTFDHERMDVRVPLGSVEDWTIRNDSDDMHVFHIHQVHFQVISVNGQPQPFDNVLDTVRVPERGEVTVRIAFTDPQIVGRFVFHCHVLKHEDKGMMANVEVYDPKAAFITPLQSQAQGGLLSLWPLALLGRAPLIGGYICHTPFGGASVRG